MGRILSPYRGPRSSGRWRWVAEDASSHSCQQQRLLEGGLLGVNFPLYALDAKRLIRCSQRRIGQGDDVVSLQAGMQGHDQRGGEGVALLLLQKLGACQR